MVQMTFDSYDKLVETIAGMYNPNPEFYPSYNEILAGISSKPKEFIRYLVFLTETGTTNTEEGKEGMKRVKQSINQLLELVDSEEEDN